MKQLNELLDKRKWLRLQNKTEELKEVDKQINELLMGV